MIEQPQQGRRVATSRGRSPVACVDVCPQRELVPAVERVLLLDGAASLTRRYHDSHFIGMTTGAYDLIHLGHIRYIEKLVEETYRRALEQDRYPLVIIGINSDESVRRNRQDRSENRPVQTAVVRAEVIACLRGVDRTFIFDDDMSLAELMPHMFQVSTGSDHPPETRPELAALSEKGTDIRQLPPQAASGSSDLIRLIHEKGIR